MSLDTLANVKTRLGITTSADDTLLGLLQDSADAWLAGYCERDFAGGTFTEYLPGATAFLFLRNYPVTGVTSVKADAGYGFGASTLVPATAYVVHAERGVIQSLTGAFLPVPSPNVASWDYGPRSVEVVYATATGSVPADVKEAYALLVGHWYRHVKTQIASGFQDVIQQSFSDTTLIFSKDQLAGLPVPDEVRRLLAPYRAPVI
jgi:Phage gp6-like head-tail connector protein